MNDDEYYEQLGNQYVQNLKIAMNKSVDDACKKVDGFKDLTPMEQELFKQMAIANVTAHFGKFNEEKNKE